MATNEQLVTRNKASLGIRFADYVVDYLMVYSIFFLFGLFAALLQEYANIDFLMNITNEISNVSKPVDYLITGLVYFSYTFLMEYFTKGRTVGKFVTGSKVLHLNGEIPTMYQFFIRNISRLVPFDGLSFFGTNGWHDSWSDTRVVKIKNFEEAKRLELELQNIGNHEME